MKTQGFNHGSRGTGIRDHQLILPSVVCSTHIAKKIADQASAVTFAHNTGCGIIGNDVGGISDFFADMANHPNINSVLIVGLGCETIQGNELAEKLLAKNASTKYLVIQESGGMGSTLKSGVDAANQLRSQYPTKKEEISTLLIGIDSAGGKGDPKVIEAIKSIPGIKIIEESGPISSENFTLLMRQGASLIISLPLGDQPTNGYPFIPVINIASNSPLHQAILMDFDLNFDSTSQEIEKLIESIANGALTKAKSLRIGEIVAPRLVRSVWFSRAKTNWLSPPRRPLGI